MMFSLLSILLEHHLLGLRKHANNWVDAASQIGQSLINLDLLLILSELLIEPDLPDFVSKNFLCNISDFILTMFFRVDISKGGVFARKSFNDGPSNLVWFEIPISIQLSHVHFLILLIPELLTLIDFGLISSLIPHLLYSLLVESIFSFMIQVVLMR